MNAVPPIRRPLCMSFRLVIEGETVAIVPRTTSSEIHRYKAYAAHPRPERR